MLSFNEFKQIINESTGLEEDVLDEEEIIYEAAGEEYDSHGWRTTKTPEGHKWEVTGFKYGKGETVLHSGIEDTRAKAMGKAKKHVLPLRRAQEDKRKAGTA